MDLSLSLNHEEGIEDAFIYVDRRVMSLVAGQAIPQGVPQTGAKTELLPAIELNENHHPTGDQHDRVLHLSLSAEKGLWYPAGQNEPGIPVQAFRDGNGPLQIPGPLIRAPAGTEIRASVRNGIRCTSLTIHGPYSHPVEGRNDLLTTKFGETSEVRFRLDTPGTYYYWGTTTNSPLEKRYGGDSQLSGAIVVGPPNISPDKSEEIFVIGIWLNVFCDKDKKDPFIGTEMAVINGRSWPSTQRLAYPGRHSSLALDQRGLRRAPTASSWVLFPRG